MPATAAETPVALAAVLVYMAPEIFDRDYHWEADTWSLGIMLYQLYARRFPYWKTYEECRCVLTHGGKHGKQ